MDLINKLLYKTQNCDIIYMGVSNSAFLFYTRDSSLFCFPQIVFISIINFDRLLRIITIAFYIWRYKNLLGCQISSSKLIPVLSFMNFIDTEHHSEIKVIIETANNFETTFKNIKKVYKNSQQH